MKFGDFVKVNSLKTPAAFRDNLKRLGLDMPCDDAVESGPSSPLAAPLAVDGLTIGNRFALQPMEGWDGSEDGQPGDNTRRRWRRFGQSGAKFIWGGEAVAVRADGRANPNQLMLDARTEAGIGELREILIAAHRESFGNDDGLVIGLQLTHSGRFARPSPSRKPEPQILYRHPVLDRKFAVPAGLQPMTDGEVRALVDDYVAAARRAHRVGFDFVDLKSCHGYLGHEFLSAKTRPGDYGGSLANRMRFLREVIGGIRAEAPGLRIGIRVSATDFVAFSPDAAEAEPGLLGPGAPDDYSAALPYRYGFGQDEHDPLKTDLTEPRAFIEAMRDEGVKLFNISVGSPYYNPHLTRPALYPPSDGYQPPEDPLIGVMRHLAVVRDLKALVPGVVLLGSGYTYLQEFLPHVAQAVVRAGWVDLVGLGRMVLSYPELPDDVLAGRGAQRKRLCRTFSDCTTAPRNGLVSGCYPLDPHYKKSPEMAKVTMIKKAANLA